MIINGEYNILDSYIMSSTILHAASCSFMYQSNVLLYQLKLKWSQAQPTVNLKNSVSYRMTVVCERIR